MQHSRVVWQGNKVRSSIKSLVGTDGDKQATSQSDVVYDGAAQVVLMGSTYNASKEVRAQYMKKGANFAPVIRNLTKERLATVLTRQSAPETQSAGLIAADMAYFQLPTGLVLAASSNNCATGKQQQTLTPSSAVLAGLNQGWKLLSVQNTQLDGRPLVRVDLEWANPIQVSAVKYDLEALRKRIEKEDDESFEKQSAKLNAEQKDKLNRSLAQQENIAIAIEAERKLPATRRYSFYLDPQLHYAVRRLDQSYGPDTLLVRSDCSEFQQIPGRNVWLPKKIESQFHQSVSARTPFPKTILCLKRFRYRPSAGIAFRRRVQTRARTTPGTLVRDGTIRAKCSKLGSMQLDGADDPYVPYTVPTKEVITRAAAGENMCVFRGDRTWRSYQLAFIFAAVLFRQSCFAMRGCSEPSWLS